MEAAAALRGAQTEAAAAVTRCREDAAAANAERARARAEAADVASATRAIAARAATANEQLSNVRRRRVNTHVVAAALARGDALLTAATARFPQPPPSPPPHMLPPGAVLISEAQAAVSEAEKLSRELARGAQDAAAVVGAAAANPHEKEVASLLSQVQGEGAALAERRAELAAAQATLSVAQRADAAFGTKGIQSYLFEGVLGDLSARVGVGLRVLLSN